MASLRQPLSSDFYQVTTRQSLTRQKSEAQMLSAEFLQLRATPKNQSRYSAIQCRYCRRSKHLSFYYSYLTPSDYLCFDVFCKRDASQDEPRALSGVVSARTKTCPARTMRSLAKCLSCSTLQRFTVCNTVGEHFLLKLLGLRLDRTATRKLMASACLQ